MFNGTQIGECSARIDPGGDVGSWRPLEAHASNTLEQMCGGHAAARAAVVPSAGIIDFSGPGSEVFACIGKTNGSKAKLEESKRSCKDQGDTGVLSNVH